jgi:large subunit ribosomal protein L29
MLSFSVTSPSSSTTSFLPKQLQFKTPFNGIRLRQPSTCTIPAANRTASVSVVMMAKREEQLKEIRTKTTEQINDEVVLLKGELVMLRIQKSARYDFKSSDFRNMRKTVYFSFDYYYFGLAEN